MSDPRHPYDGLMTWDYLVKRYGEPVYRSGFLADWTVEEREEYNIPNEVAIFRHPRNPRVPLGWCCMGGDRWLANHGERTVIGLLLATRTTNEHGHR